jgi:hypothetical protein
MNHTGGIEAEQGRAQEGDREDDDADNPASLR